MSRVGTILYGALITAGITLASPTKIKGDTEFLISNNITETRQSVRLLLEKDYSDNLLLNEKIVFNRLSYASQTENLIDCEEYYKKNAELERQRILEEVAENPVTSMEELKKYPKNMWLEIATGITLDDVKSSSEGLEIIFSLSEEEMEKMKLEDFFPGFERLRVDGCLYENEGETYNTIKTEKIFNSQKETIGIAVKNDEIQFERKEFCFKSNKIMIDTRGDFDRINVEDFKPFLDLIGKAEIGAAEEGYNSHYHAGKHVTEKMNNKYLDNGINYTELQMVEVLLAQETFREFQRERKLRCVSTAMGRYQFLQLTLMELIERYDISYFEPFSPETQDKLALLLLKEAGFFNYQKSENYILELIKNLANTWASLPKNSRGTTAYGGVASNPNTVSARRFTELGKVLKEIRGKDFYI